MSCVCLILSFSPFLPGLRWTSLFYWVIVKNVHLLFSKPALILPGEDGPSQMGLEDLCMFRAIPNSTVFYPSDAVATEKAVEIAANTKVCITAFLSQRIILSFVLLLLPLARFLHVSPHVNSSRGSSGVVEFFLFKERLQIFSPG